MCECVCGGEGEECGGKRLKEKERLWECMKQKYKGMGGGHKVNDKEGS